LALYTTRADPVLPHDEGYLELVQIYEKLERIFIRNTREEEGVQRRQPITFPKTYREIDDAFIEYLDEKLQEKVPRKVVAAQIGISAKSLRSWIHKLHEANLLRYGKRVKDDAEVKELIQKINKTFDGCWGARSIQAGITAMGYSVGRDHILEALREIDPEGVERRRSQAVVRREYKVPGPLAVLHIDGYHKLIAWKIVVHGGIDGYSRLIFYLKASTNNLATTVLANFIEGTQKYGLPLRVRGDYGGENIEVAQFMEQRRGYNRGSFMAGRSVHNQRIERFWKDTKERCTSQFYHLFREMEDFGYLDRENSLDIGILHFCYLEVLNTHLLQFSDMWNHHTIRTEGECPLALFRHQEDVEFQTNGISALQLGITPLEDLNFRAYLGVEGSVTEQIAHSTNQVVVHLGAGGLTTEEYRNLQDQYGIVNQFIDGNKNVTLFRCIKAGILAGRRRQ